MNKKNVDTIDSMKSKITADIFKCLQSLTKMLEIVLKCSFFIFVFIPFLLSFFIQINSKKLWKQIYQNSSYLQ